MEYLFFPFFFFLLSYYLIEFLIFTAKLQLLYGISFFDLFYIF